MQTVNQTVRIELMDSCILYIDETKSINLAKRSPKGANLLAYLIVHDGEAVSNQKLFASLWSDDSSANPESSLKTLVSRMRTILNDFCPGLGQGITAERGAYRWVTPVGVSVDYLEIQRIFTQMEDETLGEEEHIALTLQLVKLYKGDVVQNMPQNEWAISIATAMHTRFLNAVYTCVDLLKTREDHDSIITVCRCALDVDSFDDRLHIALMTALVGKGRTAEALVQYKHAVQMNYRYLGIEPGTDLQEFYNKIVNGEKTLDFNLEAIRRELRESEEYRGAFVCDYNVFKEIYNLQMRNLERLGSTMFLGLIMIGNPGTNDLSVMNQEAIMSGLVEICRTNLRKGDAITQIAHNLLALLLPSVNYSTGNMVLDRLRRLFYRRFPNTNIAFRYHIGPLGSDAIGDPADLRDTSEKEEKRRI